MDDIRIEYHLVGNHIDIGRLADIAVVADNIGAFYGENYLKKFDYLNPDYSATTPGEMENDVRSTGYVHVRVCIGINGSGSANPSVGWIWSKSNGNNGGNIYIYNNILYVVNGDNSVYILSYSIPTTWTNDVIREIIWAYDYLNRSQYLSVDGVIVDQDSDIIDRNIPFVGTAGEQHFLNLPPSSSIGDAVPSAARVNPSNIVARRCDVWRDI